MGAKFPLNVFPAAIQRYAKEAARSLGVDGDMIAVPMIAHLAAAIGGSRRIQLKPGWTEPVILWAGIVQAPGEKKSPVLTELGRPLRRRQHDLHQRFTAEREAWKLDVAAWEALPKKQRGPKPEEPIYHKVLVDDATMESLGVILEQNPRGVLLDSDELTSWIRSQNEYKNGGGGDRSRWLKLWSAHPVEIDRKSGPPVHVQRPVISIIAAIPPDLLNEIRDKQARADGMLDRFLFCMPGPADHHWIPDIISQEARDGYEAVLETLLRLEMETGEDGQRHPGTDRPSHRALRSWAELQNDHADQMDAGLSPQERTSFAKIPGYAARCAAVLHQVRVACGGLEEPDEVDEISVVGAWTLADYFKGNTSEAITVMTQTAEDAAVAKATAWIARKGGEGCARDMAHDHVAGVKKTSDASTLMRVMADRGLGRIDHRTVPGGTSVVFVLDEEEVA